MADLSKLVLPVKDMSTGEIENQEFNLGGGGGITDFVDIPTVEETDLYYNGSEQELVFENLDSDKVDVIGGTATIVGNYTCTLTLKSNQYVWKDLTKDPITIEWSISPSIYGVEWSGSSSPAWTRTDKSADFTDPIPYTSSISSYSSPFDDCLPWSGMVKEERTGGTMVKIPKFWYKLQTLNSIGLKIQIADAPVEGFSVSPAHVDRGDGQGERDYIYVGRYHCGSATYKSISGETPRTVTTRYTSSEFAHQLGSNIWMMDFATRFTIWLLYLVEFANWNSQEKIGYGCGNGSNCSIMGYTDSMPYHTGTTQSSRTAYGAGTQYRNIEGLWDNVYDWLDGCYYDSQGLNLILNPSDFLLFSNGINVGYCSSGIPAKFQVTTPTNIFKIFKPTQQGGGDSTYSCDNWETGDNSSPNIYTGGSYQPNLYWGLFCMGRGNDYGTGNVGYRIMELPNNL